MNKEEHYQCEVQQGGSKGLDLLDLKFNQTTMDFIKNNGIKPGMKVLDIGCGTGIMSRWLAEQVGNNGKVIAIDNNENQIEAAKLHSTEHKINNIEYRLFSAYDILDLNEKFDLIYCRFVLHHLESPRKAITLFYEALNAGGIYIGEEGLVNAAFSYPPTFAWSGFKYKETQPQNEKDGVDRDGDFGMKLYYYAKKAGFMIMDYKLVQPLLWKKEHKTLLLDGLKEFKNTAISQGMTEEQWQNKYQETVRFIDDDNQIIGFFGSCQISAKK